MWQYLQKSQILYIFKVLKILTVCLKLDKNECSDWSTIEWSNFLIIIIIIWSDFINRNWFQLCRTLSSTKFHRNSDLFALRRDFTKRNVYKKKDKIFIEIEALI